MFTVSESGRHQLITGLRLTFFLVISTMFFGLSPDIAEANGPYSGIVSAGFVHSCAIKPDGSILCWGHPSAALPPEQIGPFVFVSAGDEFHNCALKYDGSVDCWGSNAYGRADDPSGNFTQLGAGYYHSCGLTNGNAVCWGWGGFGQTTPQVGPFAQLSVGGHHNCAIKTDGSAICWGENNYGQINVPAANFTQISAGLEGTCGLTEDQKVICWGNMAQPSDQVSLFKMVSTGYWHACGLRDDGTVHCWGKNDYEQTVAPGGVFTEISAGGYHNCGLRPNGSIECWGANWYGQSSVPPETFGPYIAPNEPPVASDDTYAFDEDATLVVDIPGVLGNDTDADNDTLVAIKLTEPAHGTLQFNSDGSFTYSPELNFFGPDSFTYQASDGTEDSNVATVALAVNPVNDPPVVSWITPPVSPVIVGTTVAAETTLSDVDLGDSHTCVWDWGDGTVEGPAPCSAGSVSGSHVYMAVGSYTVTLTVTDSATDTDAVTAPVSVIWAFTGFFMPVDNPPVLNVVKAGSGVPVKFSLGGDQALNIFALGYPKSVKITCDTGAPVDGIEETLTAGNSSLQYNPLEDRYTYVWKTDKAWTGTCRQFQMMLADGTMHTANFKFK